MNIEKVFLSSNFNINEKADNLDDHTDVIVVTDTGKKYAATFFTYKNIETIRRNNEKSGDYLGGKYFWVKDMVLVQSCSETEVKNIVEHLCEEGNFNSVFRIL